MFMKKRKIKAWLKAHKEVILKGAVLALSGVAGVLAVALVRSKGYDIRAYNLEWIGVNDPDGNETDTIAPNHVIFTRFMHAASNDRWGCHVTMPASIIDHKVEKED